MDQIFMYIADFFNKFGWQTTVVAMLGIILLGVLKAVGAFDWIKITEKAEAVENEAGEKIAGEKIENASLTKQVRKFVYITVALVLSIIGSLAFLAIRGEAINIRTFTAAIVPVFSMNQITYTLYETLGVRKVWLGFLAKAKENIGTAVKKQAEKKALKAEQKAAEAETAQNDIVTKIKDVAEYLGVEPAYLEMLKNLKK